MDQAGNIWMNGPQQPEDLGAALPKEIEYHGSTTSCQVISMSSIDTSKLYLTKSIAAWENVKAEIQQKLHDLEFQSQKDFDLDQIMKQFDNIIASKEEFEDSPRLERAALSAPRVISAVRRVLHRYHDDRVVHLGVVSANPNAIGLLVIRCKRR
uniref:Retrotrans_gag domain-containing protein n=1 Tax=Haemonchus contortus TaxID=6289 RepID=A0A7I5E8X1_HAECO